MPLGGGKASTLVGYPEKAKVRFKPEIARLAEVGVSNVAGLEDNINAGSKYIRYLMGKYYADMKGDRFNQMLVTFAGYNAGPSRIANLRKKAKEHGLYDTKWFNNVEWLAAESVGPITVNDVRNIFQYFIIYSGIYERQVERKTISAQWPISR